MSSTPNSEPSFMDRPQRGDRRRRDLPLWHPRRLRGRRMRQRRADEHARPYLVDRVTARAFVLASTLLVLTLVDGLLTVLLLERGCEEANPVMRLLLDRSVGSFLVGKYLLTAAFLPVALVMYQYRLFGTRVRVGHLVPVVAAMYAALIVYQVGLWQASGAVAGPAADGLPSAPRVEREGADQ